MIYRRMSSICLRPDFQQSAIYLLWEHHEAVPFHAGGAVASQFQFPPVPPYSKPSCRDLRALSQILAIHSHVEGQVVMNIRRLKTVFTNQPHSVNSIHSFLAKQKVGRHSQMFFYRPITVKSSPLLMADACAKGVSNVNRTTNPKSRAVWHVKYVNH